MPDKTDAAENPGENESRLLTKEQRFTIIPSYKVKYNFLIKSS